MDKQKVAAELVKLAKDLTAGARDTYNFKHLHGGVSDIFIRDEFRHGRSATIGMYSGGQGGDFVSPDSGDGEDFSEERQNSNQKLAAQIEKEIASKAAMFDNEVKAIMAKHGFKPA